MCSAVGLKGSNELNAVGASALQSTQTHTNGFITRRGSMRSKLIGRQERGGDKTPSLYGHPVNQGKSLALPAAAASVGYCDG